VDRFVRYWRKILQKISSSLSSPRARILERKLAAARHEKQTLLAEITDVESELDGIRGRDREQLKAFEQRLGQIESERELARRQLQTIGHSLSEAITSLESTQRQVGLLDTKLENERRKHRGEMQEARDRAHRQERRLNWAFMVAGCAVLLGAMAGVTGFRDTQNNARVLADLSRDIKDIKASMQQQLGSMRESLEEYRLSLLDGLTPGPSPDPRPPLAAKPAGRPDRHQAETAATESTFGFHPHNKYRTRSEMRAFFAENARDLGVITLDSGLQYKVLSRGNGRSPGQTDRVVFEYRTYLADGSEIYSSYQEPEPAAYRIDELIPGLQEALQHMNEGARWELYVPPKLAHRGVRKRGRGKLAFEPMIYVVELKSVMEGGQTIEN
jgi:FKBP-type peptidyl-prolyl cis-trans isomerase